MQVLRFEAQKKVSVPHWLERLLDGHNNENDDLVRERNTRATTPAANYLAHGTMHLVQAYKKW